MMVTVRGGIRIDLAEVAPKIIDGYWHEWVNGEWVNTWQKATGEDGSNYLIPVDWLDGAQYKRSNAGIPVVKVQDGTSLGFSVYSLIKNLATTQIGKRPGDSSWNWSEYWKLVSSEEYIYLQETYIERLQAVLVTAEKIESLMIKTKNIEILEGAIVRGQLEGVSGSFKRLECIDNAGKSIGRIKFGDDGTIWFENCTLQHQAPTGPFLASDIWTRGVLGVQERTTLIIRGTSYGYVYKNGLHGTSQYVSLTSGTDSSGNVYYNIPLYSPTTETSGMPIDLVIINHSSSVRYNLQSINGKFITIVNSNDKNSGVYIYANGVSVRLDGGKGANLVCVGGNQSPDSSSWLGRGWLVTGQNDNNWS